MRERLVKTCRGWSLVLSCALVLGCASTSKQAQLEAVAKDWSAVIRASQIIPVYPLTEDLQPGDVFLVQVPIDRQQEIYKKEGYLPLDNHIARIDLAGYTEFYDHSFEVPGSGGKLPRDWMDRGSDGTAAWKDAPGAAFPSYSFQVKRGQGLNLALPVQSIPIGLSLLSSNEAHGSVTIGKARTLGIDIRSAWEELRTWSRDADNRRFLTPFASGQAGPNYLRVITRIYLTGQLDVSLQDARTQGAGVDADVPRPVDLLTARRSQTADIEDYEKNVTKLNDMLEATQGNDSGAGGSVRVMAASSRAISLKEDFDPPLVIGYLGFDCLIGENGQLGPPIPTHALLLDLASQIETTGGFTDTDNVWFDVFDAASASSDADAVFRDALTTLDPDWLGIYDALKARPEHDESSAFAEIVSVYWKDTDDGVDDVRQQDVIDALREALASRAN